LLKGWFKTYGKRFFYQNLGSLFFEGLSYLGSLSRGWHDSLSGTYVVKKEISKTLLSASRRIWRKDKTVETKIRLFIVNCIQAFSAANLFYKV
jgi:hypothetical protein